MGVIKTTDDVIFTHWFCDIFLHIDFVKKKKIVYLYWHTDTLSLKRELEKEDKQEDFVTEEYELVQMQMAGLLEAEKSLLCIHQYSKWFTRITSESQIHWVNRC